MTIFKLKPSAASLRSSRVIAVAAVLANLACAPRSVTTGPRSIESSDAFDDVDVALDVEPTDRPAPYFARDGAPFCFIGANNYYLMYKDRRAVTNVLDSARAMGATVLRTWAFLDRGALDGSVPHVHGTGHKDGVYFQYWDPGQARPAYNDGPDGLERLDFVLHEARERGLALILTLTNNWRDFGGMDQYLAWYGLKAHRHFFADARVRAAYRAWVAHVVTRVNTIDGVPYKDDPAIFAWELANEPRLIGSDATASTESWDTTLISSWAEEMSAFVKSLDPDHMVSVGDEGFFHRGGEHPAYRGQHGVDHERLTALPNVDFGTYHLYPDHWETSTRWGNQWIADHLATSYRLDKPIVLEEYGLRVARASDIEGPVVQGAQRRASSYRNWNELIFQQGGAGSLVWMLAGDEVNGTPYPDYDRFTVHAGDATYALLQQYGARVQESRACQLARGAAGKPATAIVQARPAPHSTQP